MLPPGAGCNTLGVVTFGQYAAEYSMALDNDSRRGITGVDKELFMQLSPEARKVFTNRLCRSAFRSTGIYISIQPTQKPSRT